MNDKEFVKLENRIFGYGYGSGEEYTLRALKNFLRRTGSSKNYDYRVFETDLGETITWLMINALCKADIIEYGCSPRFGWLTGKGEELKEYLEGKSVDELYDLLRLEPQEKEAGGE